MRTIRRWSFPVLLIVSWIIAGAHVLTRLANLHSTLAKHEPAMQSHPRTAQAHAFARR